MMARAPLVRSAALLAIGLILAIGVATAAHAATLPAGFQDSVVFAGLEEPTKFRFAPDGRVFVAEKSGKILVFDSLEDESPTLFADLRTKVYDNHDRGLLGLALDPKFDEGSPFVYVLYTYDHLLGDPAPPPKWGEADHSGDECPLPPGVDVDECPVSGRLVRLTADGDHAVEEAGAPKEDIVVEDWCQQFSSHSIGNVQFGPEGALYVSGGDGASFDNYDYGQFGWPEKNQCGDPPAGLGGSEELPDAEGGALRAQDLRTPSNPLDPTADPTSLDGTLIRIDPSSGEGMAGNPLSGSFEPNERRIIAYGFRNPFRFAIDPTTDELYVDNVGWGDYEEMDRFAAVPSQPYNSGWPCWEGPEWAYIGIDLTLCKDLLAEEPGASSQPFFYYTHSAGVTPEDPCPTERGSAITGITFYEGESLPAKYHGALFFADGVRGCIYVMFPGEGGRPDPATAEPFMTEATPYAGVDLEVGPEGDLYYTSLGEGQIHRIAYFSGNQPPVAHLKVDHPWSAGDLEAEFDASESSDAESEALEYEWDTNEDGEFSLPSTNPTVNREWTDAGNHTVAVRVVDGHDLRSVAKITVYPHDTPPNPQIIAPVESLSKPGKAALEWHVGQQIHFEGLATDAEDGELEHTNLDWNTRVLHCPFGPEACHFHPLRAFPGVTQGTLTAPDHDYPSRIVLTLRATDSRGLTVTRTLELEAHPVQLEVESQPAGIPVTASLLTKATPFALTAIEDSHITLVAPATATVGGTEYAWTGWSDGLGRAHTIEAKAAGAYKAIYAPVSQPAKEELGGAEKPSGGGSVSPGAGSGASGAAAPPQAAIGGHPAKRSRRSSARFSFSDATPGAGFECKLDGGRYRPCTSPRTYRGLRPGKHVFRVIATKGEAHSTPAVFRWKVL